ncbi:hypothetical protein F4859DRAFT_521700 [Xylaria cf. heliscus]|nr:hypothetical protein F4859DRAFT_521700 [Xylaria cf. heliscus]
MLIIEFTALEDITYYANLMTHGKFYIAQCLTATVQIGLVDLMKSFGIIPVAVVGHSMGEIAAAYCAEFLTRDSALRIAYYRGLFTATIPEKVPTRGAMLVAGLSSERVAAYFKDVNSNSLNSSTSLVVSCINSPCNTTVSGEESEIDSLKQILSREGIFARRLRVPVAYHSPQMELIVSDCLRGFGALQSPRSTHEIKMVSSVTGSALTREGACEGSYWTTNMTSPVLFSYAIERLCRDSIQSLRKKIDGSHREAIVVDTLVEIGPHAALQLPIEQIIKPLSRSKEITYLSALYRKQSASLSLLRLLGQLHCSGVRINLRHVNDPDQHLRQSRISIINAPEYPFDHSTRYWFESPLVQNYRLRVHGHESLLGSPSRDWNPLEPQWRCCVQISEMPWLLDHQLTGKVIYPASAMILMVMQGVSQLSEQHQRIAGLTFRNVQYESAIAVPSDSTSLETRLQLRLLKPTSNPNSPNSIWNFSVYSVTAGRWAENCSGTVEVHHYSKSWADGNMHRSSYYKRAFEARNNIYNETLESLAIYNNFSAHGFAYGPLFQGIKIVRHDGIDTLTADIDLSNALSRYTADEQYIIHPGTLDSFFHLALVTLSKGSKAIPTQAISRIDRLWVSAEGLQPSYGTLRASAKFEGETPLTKKYSAFALTDDEKEVKLIVDGLQTTVISSVEESEKASEYHQFWCGIQTAVDFGVLSGADVLKRLESICGPDSLGPADFLRDLRRYLFYVVRKLHLNLKEVASPNKPYIKRYIDWMDWQLSAPKSELLSATKASSLEAQLRNQGILGNFFLKVTDNALNVLKGESNMVQLMFEDDSVETFYMELFAHSTNYQKVQAYLEHLSFKNPDMDFLEVGAGTGSFTQHILAALSSSIRGTEERFHSYYFTDISPAFFDRARERFSSHSHKLKFAIFNAEQDPLHQGFDEQAFDIISASNVLHIMNNIDRALLSLRRLLKAGGKLLLHEYIHPERIDVGFVFGLLPGWWPETDDSRRFSPLLSEEEWDIALRRNGFSGADFIIRDFADEDSHLMSIICATATESEEGNLSFSDVAIVVEPDSIEQSEMAEALISRSNAEGYRMFCMDLTSPHVPASPVNAVVTLFDLGSAILSRLNEQIFESLKCLLLSATTVLWVSKVDGPFADPSHGMIDGFARVFRTENINSKLATLALEKGAGSRGNNCSLVFSSLGSLLRLKGLDQPEDYTVRDGQLTLSRICENTSLKGEMSEILSGERRVRKSLQDAKPFKVTLHHSQPLSLARTRITRDHSTCIHLDPEELEIEIQAVSLNPIDFSVISGQSSGISIGRECAGIVSRVGASCKFAVGDRVCAYGTDMFCSTGRVNQKHVAMIPESMSFEEASTLPQDYLIANYLVGETRIQRGDIVLVHGGDTRLGRATLEVLKKYTLKLCATAAVPENKQNLIDGVHWLQESCLAEPFQARFYTKASVVLDFLNSNPLSLTDCMSQYGQFLSVRAGTDSSAVPRNHNGLLATIRFRIVGVVEVLKHQLAQLKMVHSDVGEPGAKNPITVKTIDLSSIDTVTTSAIDLRQEERLVIKYDDWNQIQIYEQSTTETLFDPCASYVISGGLGDLGRCIATWMVTRGARNLILLSRSGPRSERAKATIRYLEQQGAIVHAPLCDITDRSSLQHTLHQLHSAPPIRGCIQTAGALKDIMYSKMTFKDWKVAVDPKTLGSWHLHDLLPKGMDFFILTSSISGIVGQPTQINYAAGNTYQDALAHYRHSLGEKAVSLDLGILATGGLVSHTEGLMERLVAENVYTVLSEREILALFEYFYNPHLKLGQIPPQIISGIVNPSLQDRRKTNFPPAFSHPLWSQIFALKGSDEEPGVITSGNLDLSRSLKQASSVAEMTEIVADALAGQISSLSLTPRATIRLEEPLHKAGADSLTAVYLRNWITKEFAVDVAIFDILGDMSIIALGKFIANESWASRVPN